MIGTAALGFLRGVARFFLREPLEEWHRRGKQHLAQRGKVRPLQVGVVSDLVEIFVNCLMGEVETLFGVLLCCTRRQQTPRRSDDTADQRQQYNAGGDGGNLVTSEQLS